MKNIQPLSVSLEAYLQAYEHQFKLLFVLEILINKGEEGATTSDFDGVFSSSELFETANRIARHGINLCLTAQDNGKHSINSGFRIVITNIAKALKLQALLKKSPPQLSRYLEGKNNV